MTKTILEDPASRYEPVAATLGRVGAELAAVAGMIHSLEDVVGLAISTANTTRELQIEELQQLDRTRQKIEGAAEFLNALTEALPAEWLVDATNAARSVSMSDLARRFAGQAAFPAPAHQDEVYELF